MLPLTRKYFHESAYRGDVSLLVACLGSEDDDETGMDQEALLKLQEKMRGRLDIRLCPASGHDWFTGPFRILGTPTYLLFGQGRELRRLLGRTDVQGLLDFVG